MSSLYVYDSDGKMQYPESGSVNTHIKSCWSSHRYLIVDASDQDDPPTLICYVNAKRPGQVRKQYYLVYGGDDPSTLFEDFLATVDQELVSNGWEIFQGNRPRQQLYQAIKQGASSPTDRTDILTRLLKDHSLVCSVNQFTYAVGLIRSLNPKGHRFVVTDDKEGLGSADLGIYRDTNQSAQIHFDEETEQQMKEIELNNQRNQAFEGVSRYVDLAGAEQFFDDLFTEVIELETSEYEVVEQSELETDDEHILTAPIAGAIAGLSGLGVGVLIGIYIELLISSVQSVGNAVIEIVRVATQYAMIDLALLGLVLPLWIVIAATLFVTGLVILLLIFIKKESTLSESFQNISATISNSNNNNKAPKIDSPASSENVIGTKLNIRGTSEADEVTVSVKNDGNTVGSKPAEVTDGQFEKSFYQLTAGEYELVVTDGHGKDEITIQIKSQQNSADHNYGWTV